MRAEPPPFPPLALELRDVSKWHGSRSYGKRVLALDQVSVSFCPGQWTAIMGPSGSGKSTLLYCASGLQHVDRGKVFLAGQDITRADDRELTRLRRSTIGFIFQNLNLIESLTASENISLPLHLTGKRVSQSAVGQLLGRVGLQLRASYKPRELSGGQQQRVAIARAVAIKPTVLFADEPTGALDSSTAREILTLMRELVDEQGQTIVMVTHDPSVAASADRVIFLKDGQLVDGLSRPTITQVASRLVQLEQS